MPLPPADDTKAPAERRPGAFTLPPVTILDAPGLPRFAPDEVTVRPGGTVTWTHGGAQPLRDGAMRLVLDVAVHRQAWQKVEGFRCFGDQDVATRQEGHAPGHHQPIGHGHEAIVMARRAHHVLGAAQACGPARVVGRGRLGEADDVQTCPGGLRGRGSGGRTGSHGGGAGMPDGEGEGTAGGWAVGEISTRSRPTSAANVRTYALRNIPPGRLAKSFRSIA